MTPVTSDQIAAFAQQRAQLDAERRRIQKAYCLTVLDHVAAKVRQACPEAAYIGVAYDGKTRELDLLGVLGEQTSPLGGLPWLWEANNEEHPLAELAVEIEADVETALKPYDSPAWATVRRNSASDGNLWLIELPRSTGPRASPNWYASTTPRPPQSSSTAAGEAGSSRSSKASPTTARRSVPRARTGRPPATPP